MPYPRRLAGIAFALMLLAGALPAGAAEWGHYENGRFGFAIDVPPGFAAQGESANGDGNRFTTPTAELRAFGGFVVVDTSFAGEITNQQSAWTDDGWTLTYQVTTPSAASFSGRKGNRILYARIVAACGGDEFIGFTLEYSRADLKQFDPVVDRLVRSLKPPAAC